VHQIVIDPEDEFRTLREKFDYVLAGSDGGDCVADVKSAAMLARKLLELNISAIIGIYELKPRERIRFVKIFLETLINAPRELWHPVLIVLDEAHVFCPQTGSAESFSAVTDLMTRGRKRGFCGVLATQRIAKLHKDAAAECNNKLIGRAVIDIDQRRAADELGFATKKDRQKLRTLKPGHFYAFGPAISDDVVEMIVGSVVTTHPKAGQRAMAPPPPRSKIKRVLAQLANLPAEAEQEGRTVAELKTQLRGVQRELRQAKKGAPDPEAIQKAFDKGHHAGGIAANKETAQEVGLLRTEVSTLRHEQEKQLRQLERRRTKVLALISKAASELDGAPPIVIAVKPTQLPPVRKTKTKSHAGFPGQPAKPKQPAPLPLPGMNNGNGHSVNAPRQKLLDTIGMLESWGLAQVSRAHLVFARISAGSKCLAISSFPPAAALRSHGWASRWPTCPTSHRRPRHYRPTCAT
jgi:hypothetical protein